MKYRLSAGRKSRFLPSSLIVSLLLALPAAAQASCHVTGTRKVNFTLPDISLSGASGPGTILSEKSLDLEDGNTSQPFICSGDGHLDALTRYLRRNGQGIFATGVGGIGYRLILDNHPFPWHSTLRCQGDNCHLPWPVAPRITFQLVQTLAKIETGKTIDPGIYGLVKTDAGQAAAIISLQHAVHLHQESCWIQNQHVDFGRVEVPAGVSAGAVLGTRKFALQYSCTMPDEIVTRWEGIADSNGNLVSPVLKDKKVAISIQKQTGEHLRLNQRYFTTPQDGELAYQAQLLSTGNTQDGGFYATATLHVLYP